MTAYSRTGCPLRAAGPREPHGSFAISGLSETQDRVLKMSVASTAPAIPGEIVTHDGATAQVRIVALSTVSCCLDDDAPEGAAELWLGAIGPFRVRRDGSRADRLVFDGSIHPAIASHFNAVLAVEADDGADLPDATHLFATRATSGRQRNAA